MGYDGHLSFDTTLDEKGFSTGIGKLGSIAKSGLAVLGASVAGVTTAFGAMTKEAVSSVASLEQNIGGVETLFKDSAQTVIANANRAYQTAGLSANDYMQNVTSFSASLLQSVAGDTAEAAKIADMAMIDMSDNANKMGTDMQSIQNAYQGFAKQNYTMLDNLKLGYGGTKEEMQRLLADASELSGVKYDISNLSDVYNAIHVIQENLDITGTTAKEAAVTIEGSMNAAKAAWDNFLNGSGSAEEFADAITTAAINIGSNLTEIVPRLAETVPIVLQRLGEAFDENADQVIQMGADVIADIATGIIEQLPSFVETAVSLIQSFVTSLSSNIPMIVSSGGALIKALISGVIQLLPSIAELGLTIIQSIAQSIISYASQLAAAGQSSVGNYVDGMLRQLPAVITAGGQILNQLVEKFLSGLPQMLSSGVQLISQLAQGILNNIPAILSAIASVLAQLAATIVSHLPELLQLGIELIGKLAAGLIQAIPQLLSAIPQIFSSVKSAFSGLNWLQIGKDIVNGIAKGLTSAIGSIVSAAKSVGEAALNGLKGLLGIHSPSRVFRDEVGKNIALGIADGITKNKQYAKKSAEEIAQATLDAAKKKLENHKVYNDLTAADEAAFWDEVRKQTKDGTQARIDADKEYFTSKKNLNEKMQDAEETYAKNVAQAYSDLNDKIQDLNQEYRDAVASRTDEIKNAYGLFDEFDSSTDLTSEDLLNNLQSQVEGLREWQNNLHDLEDRGIDSALLTELQDLGPKSAAQIRLLTEMTDDELDDYVSLFRQKNRLATKQAVEELAPMQQDISQQISSLKQQTQQELAEYQQEYISAMEALGVALDQPAEELKLAMAQNAVELVAQLASSIKTEAGSNENKEQFKAIADNILNSTETLPSDMLAVGQTTIESMIQGIQSRSGALAQAMAAVVSGAVSQALAAVISDEDIASAVQATDVITSSASLPAAAYGNEGYGPGYAIDYARMGDELRDALNGVEMTMDGQRVGQIVSEPVNDALGGQSRREERDIV